MGGRRGWGIAGGGTSNLHGCTVISLGMHGAVAMAAVTALGALVGAHSVVDCVGCVVCVAVAQQPRCVVVCGGSTAGTPLHKL